MNNIGITNNLLCASEFALSIALTVFIILTVILVLLLIFLAASKSFRAVFFREKPQRKRNAKKADKADKAEAAEPTPTPVDTAEQARPARTSRRSNNSATGSQTPEYLAAIPTVPLNVIQTAPAPKPRAGRKAAADDELKAQEGSTYTTRSITITRASAAKAAADKPQNERSTKRR